MSVDLYEPARFYTHPITHLPATLNLASESDDILRLTLDLNPLVSLWGYDQVAA